MEGFEFTGKINIDVRPYLLADFMYDIDIKDKPFTLNITLYSARYPDSYYRWESYAIEDIRQKIVINRQKKEIQELKAQIGE